MVDLVKKIRYNKKNKAKCKKYKKESVKLMEQNIKYELIINKALRSALEYDTPDEQINEFIRFFGKHIGSDRFYIFEDDIKHHATDNTYEWCAMDVIPQINELQQVDMDIIRWWYEAFDKGENIVISDVEDIKENHPISYDILKMQNVENLAVSPLRYKDDICGFFGVDNPPKGNFKRLSEFLEMIGTLLISLLKLRNSFQKTKESAKLSSYSALAQIYLTMYLVDVKTGTYYTIKRAEHIDNSGNIYLLDDFPKQITTVMKKLCEEKDLKDVLAFLDVDTLEERLGDKNTIENEFVGKISGWCRQRFIKVDQDEEGHLEHVLYCIEGIDAQKQRESKLRYLSETDRMTGLYNRVSGERKIIKQLERNRTGLLCLIDCDKFKRINDTYGHAVGDQVIIAVAEALKKSCREHDIVLRLGGDEFAMFILGLTTKELAQMFADRIFNEMKKISIKELRDDDHIYVSFGAAFALENEMITFDQLYRKADAAMYHSKKHFGYYATLYEKDMEEK